mmetsp:Transcript_32786/g.80748  ORF Transcript_32786/g.80748 Transcript_32786/m.80748 type:complete len:347 (-) Transcript_32786:452-1492(-)
MQPRGILPPRGIISYSHVPSYCHVSCAQAPLPRSTALLDVPDVALLPQRRVGLHLAPLHLALLPRDPQLVQPLVLLLALHLQAAADDAAVGRLQRRLQEERLLPPVRRAVRVRRRGKLHRGLVGAGGAALEGDVEPAGEGAHLRGGRARALDHAQLERQVQALHLVQGHGEQVKLLQGVRLPQQLARVDVHPRGGVEEELALLQLERLGQRRHVHPVVVARVVHKLVPPAARVLKISVLLRAGAGADGRNVHLSVAGEHRARVLQPPVSRHDDGVEHGLAQEEVPHPLGDDHVHLLRQLHLLHRALDHLDDVLQPVCLDQLARVDRHVGCLHCVHLLGTSLRGPDG